MKKNFRDRWLHKAVKITGYGLNYICYDDTTYNEAIQTIRNSGCNKPNRVINKLRDYRKSLND